MQIHCPQCHKPTPAEPGSTVIVCSTCGASFHLEPVVVGTTEWRPEPSPRKLGRFEVLEAVGVGSYGTVYRARDPELDRIVALKVPRFQAKADDIDRLKREARSSAQLKHPSIVPVLDVVDDQGVTFLVSEFVQGITLADHLTARPCSPREAAELAAALADALHYAHQQGVVHRDVKPANVMLENTVRARCVSEGSTPPSIAHASGSEAPTPRLMDFGLAKRDAGEITMTLDGHVLGTPAYMSPEQAAGDSHVVDGRTDVYSLGVVLYQMLTGELPFRGNVRMMIHQVLNEDPQPPTKLNNHIPRDLEAICLKAMSKEPLQRYATAQAMGDDLRAFLRGEPVKARRIGIIGKLWRWLRRPERVRDAGIVMIVQGGLVILFGLSLVLPALLYARNSALVLVGFVILPKIILQVWLGALVVQRRAWAIWMALLLDSLTLGGLVLLVAIVEAWDGTVDLTEFLAIFPVSLWFAPFPAPVLALLSYYSNRNVMRWRREQEPVRRDSTSKK